MVDIIRAHDDDWPLVREIRLRSLSSDPSSFGQSWDLESTYDDDAWIGRVHDAAWFLALEGEQPVGVIASRHEADSPTNERELQAMWVTPRSRKGGVARRLAEAVLNWAKEDGADTVTLYVGPRNTPARGLYDALGFTDTGDRWEVVQGEPDSAWIKMALPLA
jgi:ribosomal protein S18 acetylase RimI-like enzyme